MIKPHKKPKKKRNQTIGYWQRKADKKLQEICRTMYQEEGCLVCGGEYACSHHFQPKSRSTHLRYNIRNLIPICHKHHMAHHSGDSRIHAIIILYKGEEWLETLLREEKAHRYTKAGYKYYRDMYERLCIIEPLKLKV